MMATQIIQLDVRATPSVVRVRDDVSGVLVVATAGGRPIDLLRLPRPAAGVFSSLDALRSIRAYDDSVTSAVGTVTPVSVVVCTRERPDDLARCLESLDGLPPGGHEVIVVDNAPATARTAAVAARFAVRSVTEPRMGLNRARNAGVAVAAHDVVAFVDDDVVVSQGWVSAISACFADPAVGCATGLVLPLELETTAQEQFELYSQHRRDLQPRVYSRSELQASAAGVVGMGANMAYRRDLLKALGGFDVRLDAGTCTRSGGDTDMFARVLDTGRLIVYSPDAQVWHRHRRLTREVTSCVFGYGVGLYSMLTKRVLEQHDFGAFITAGRWLVGPVVKAARAKIARRPAPRWNVVLAETAGAAVGPFCFGYEAWRERFRSHETPGA